ncbi:MAG: YajG family lipoprotein [Pseudomonadota bacterium]|nr:YajG family lipoprotein [Pseudomonadota bacterium]
MRILSALIMVVVAAMLLGSCALSPQTVALTPRVDAPSQPIGQGRTLALEVVDRRPERNFGSRGGTYQTAVISPRTDVDLAVRQALTERLRASQFNVVPYQPDAPLAMQVEILQIAYQVQEVGLLKDIHARSAIQATVRNGPTTLSGRYQANSARRELFWPNETENEAIINEVVGEALKRLFQDQAIVNLLAR